MKIKRIPLLLILTALILTVCALPFFAEQSVIEGNCGNSGVTYKLTSDNAFILGGEGQMPDYVGIERPWDNYTETITSITIGDNVTSIGADAFLNLNMTVTIPTTVTVIGDHAFGYTYDGSGYVKIDGFTIIGDEGSTAHIYAQNNGFSFVASKPEILSGVCGTELTYTLTQDGVLTVSGNGEMFDYSLQEPAPWDLYLTSEGGFTVKSVVIGEGVTHIGSYAFIGATSLTSVTFSQTVTSIGDYAFSSCSFLTQIVLPQSLTRIGSNAFQLTAITSITIPSGVIEAGECIFRGCSHLTSAIISSSFVPSKAFSECTELESVVMDEGVTVVESSAFENCRLLKNVSMPITLTKIKQRAFANCSSLVNVKLPLQFEELGVYAFSDCTSLASFTFSDIMEIIPEGAFYNCTALSSVVLGDSVNEITTCAFLNCTSLKSIYVSYKVRSIGAYAIGYQYANGAYSVISAFVPEIEGFTPSAAQIYAEANGLTFKGNKTVDTDTGDVNDSIIWKFRPSTGILNIIGSGNMPDYTSFDETPWSIYGEYIKQVVFSDKITSVGNNSFNGCSAVEKIVIPSSVTRIGDNAFKSTSVVTLDIPEGVEQIGVSAFEGASKLITVNLPTTLISIGKSAFFGTDAMTTVFVPQSVSYIGDKALGYALNGNVIEGFIIKGFENSLVQSYAKQNNITFIINGYVEVTNKENGVIVLIPDDKNEGYSLLFNQLGTSLEPDVLLAQTQKAIVYEIQVLLNGKTAQINGSASVTMPIPESMESYIFNLYTQNDDGTFSEINYVKNSGRITFSTNKLGKLVFTNADLTALNKITVKYSFSDGKNSKDTIVIMASKGAQYSFSAEEVDGYILNTNIYSGTVGDSDIDLEFSYEKKAIVTTEPPAITEPQKAEKNSGGARTVLIIFLILMIIALIAAVVLLIYLNMKKRKQSLITRRTMAAAKKQSDADSLAKTMIIPDFETREINIESLFADEPEEDIVAEEEMKTKIDNLKRKKKQ